MTTAKVFYIFFPDFQKISLNSAIVCRHQKSNLQIYKFLTSATYHVNPSTNPHNLLLSIVLQLYQLYNEEYEYWCENFTSAKPSDNVELMTLINLYKAKR